jgi:hypothetical protein
VNANTSLAEITELFQDCVTIERVLKSKSGESVYLVLANESMVTRAISSLRGLTLGDWV